MMLLLVIIIALTSCIRAQSTATLTTPITRVTSKVIGAGEPQFTTIMQDGTPIRTASIHWTTVDVTVTIYTTVIDSPAEPTPVSTPASTSPAKFLCSAGTNCQPDENTLTLSCPDGQPCSSTTAMQTYSCNGGETCTPSVTTATLSCSTGGSCNTTLPLIPIIPIPLPAEPPPVPPPEVPEIPEGPSACSIPSVDPAISASIRSWIDQFPFTLPEIIDPSMLSSMTMPPSSAPPTSSAGPSPTSTPTPQPSTSTVPFIAPSPAQPTSSSFSFHGIPMTTTTSIDAASASSFASEQSLGIVTFLSNEAAKNPSWKSWASSTCQHFTMPTARANGGIGLEHRCALELDRLDFGKPWPQDADFFLFQEYDPDTSQIYIDFFCQIMADNKIVIGPDGDKEAKPGVCWTFGRTCQDYNKNHVCIKWKTAPGMYGHGVTFGMTWNSDWCQNQKKSYKVDLDQCKKRFTNDVLKRCRVDKDNKGMAAMQPYLNIGGTYYGEDECVAWTIVSIPEPPPDAWF